jgi:hypothetical protein
LRRNGGTSFGRASAAADGMLPHDMEIQLTSRKTLVAEEHPLPNR